MEKLKEEYILMRNAGVFDPRVLYTYMLSKGSSISWEAFSIGLPFLNLEHALEQLNQEFEVQALYSPDGKFIKIVQ